MTQPVALVNMPFGPAVRPSIQIGILRALLDRAGIPGREFHLAVDFYDLLRENRCHSQYSPDSPSMVSEWYFSERAMDFAPFGRDFQAVMRLQQFARATGFPYKSMLDVRNRLVPAFMERAAQEVLAAEPRLVCFTISYAQLNASFALARRLKAERPDLMTLFGGAGSQVFEEACREYMRVFPQVDAMLVGEAETALADLVRRMLDPTDLSSIPDLFYRRDGAVTRSEATAPALALDEAVVPNFDGWFAKREAMPKETRRLLENVILMELGRGCTWGDELTCKFCAFLFHGKYRGKSKRRVLEELRGQSQRYGARSFFFVDDIVTNAQISEMFPEFQETVPGMRVPFMEIRATVTKRHVETMAKAGVTLVQPGTECFDDGLLKRISKGTTTFHNLQLLKFARESGIRVSHNVILEIPGATQEELEFQLRVIRLIAHFDPPYFLSLQLVRFSPYHEERDWHGFQDFQADPFYRAILPEGTDIEKVAYEFTCTDPERAKLRRLYEKTVVAIQQWQGLWGSIPQPFLMHEPEGEGLLITDGRATPGRPVRHRFDALGAAVHAAIADRPMGMSAVMRALPARFAADEAGVAAVLKGFAARELALEVGGRYFSLATEAARIRPHHFGLPEPAPAFI